jgi:outer membrane protein insertion porin family
MNQMKTRQKAMDKGRECERIFSLMLFAFLSNISAPARLCVLILLLSVCLFAQNNFENRAISDIQISFTGTDRDVSAAEQFRLIAQSILIGDYSTVKIRETLQALYSTEKIVSAQVEATPVGENQVSLRFIIKRKTQAERVTVRVGNFVGTEVTEEQLLLRVNIQSQGGAVTEQVLRSNADAIQNYLRDRGYYSADVTYTQTPLGDANRVAVAFQVNPNTAARVENFAINIEGFDAAPLREDLNLKTGEFFSRRRLEEDVTKIRQAILKQGYLAPRLNDARVTYDPEKNTINIEMTGEIGPKVNVKVEAGNEEVGEGTQTRLLPIRREGTLDYSAIIEGGRRLRNHFQERGYFFVEVEAVCSVTPPFPSTDANPVENNTNTLCGSLASEDLDARVVDVTYRVDLNRRLRLEDIRIEGTDKITVEEIASVLDTQRASLLGFIPRLGYGRGYTSNEILEDDRRQIEAIMRELGYRRARARVLQGVSPTGDDLIITFVVTEGPLTRIGDIDIENNKAFDDDRLKQELPVLIGRPLSRARARNGVQKLTEFYANQGYFDARVTFSIVEPQPPGTLNAAGEEEVKIVYNIENEGKRVFINRILINGNDYTKREAILRAITLREGELLKAVDITQSEQHLYATDAFVRVEIKTEEAGETSAGDKRRDIIINVEEQQPRIMNYGGGFSTDGGPFGSFDIRYINLFGKLQQGGALARMSRLRQLVQLNYLDPRFVGDGRNRWAPLNITAQYQRDSTVTRFFRSVFDQGTMGIVQRIDEEGNPIDIFGNETGEPTINRLTVTAETQRTINRESRSILFVRYRFEDVRLFNIESLLIADLLAPDARIRTSGFGATFVRDTRQNCNRRNSLLELISKGDLGDPCRYSPTDPTKGSYLTAEYNVSVPFLGANIGFHKFQGTYQTYYTFPKLKNTTLAGRAILGLATVFADEPRFPAGFEALNGSLPISERFFAGGSTSIRGFDLESAGPRIVIVPQGTFRNNQGEQVVLRPFTVPFGGNALAIVNLEARLPVTEGIQAVPFYDGGNVFRRVGDIFNPPDVDPNDVLRSNLRAVWTHTVGLGLRIKTPIGGAFAIDFAYLTNPPRFLIPQINGTNAIYQLRQTQLHFRFTQAF